MRVRTEATAKSGAVGAVVSVLAGASVLATGAVAFPSVYPDGATINEPGAAEGYVLYAARDDIIYLVDDAGTVVHTWSAPCAFEGPQQALDGGHVLTGACSGVVELDWNGAVVWQYTPPEGVETHHGWERLPDGNTLILCRQAINDPAISDEDFLEDFIVEVDPSGDVVWEWYESDHFDELSFSQPRIDQIRERGGDWSHATSVASIPDGTSHSDPRFSPGNILIALRHQNTLAVIDRGTGQIVWVYTDFVIGPHDARMIAGELSGEGNILVFDNGYAGDWSIIANLDRSQVLEVEPVSSTIAYRYRDVDSGQLRGAFFSHMDGGSERLDNGNTLITEASFGRIFEVTPTGEIVWEYVLPFEGPVDGLNGTYRATKVALDWAGPYFVPDVVVTGEATPDPVEPETDLHYAIQVQNIGPDPAVGAEFVTATPEGTTLQAFTSPSGWSCTTPGPGGAGAIACTTPGLAVGPAVWFTLTVRTGSCLDDRTTLGIEVNVSSIGDDASPGDNSTTIAAIGASSLTPIEDLTATLVAGGQDVRLDWGDATPACGYRVLRGTAPEGGFTDVSGALGGTMYVDSGAGLAPESYYYVVGVTDSP